MLLRHRRWTRQGRQLFVFGGRQRVYTGRLGQRNVELSDGSFAPFVWNDDSRALRYDDIEARFSGASVEFWREGLRAAKTTPKVQRRERAGFPWRDVEANVRIERLSDEDDLGPIASARIAIVLEGRGFRARHIVVAGGWHRARGDTELVADRPGEYRVVLEHEMERATLSPTTAIAANGWRVAWTEAESAERQVEVTPTGLRIELAPVACRRRDQPATLWVSPDTYGPATNAGSWDDVLANSTYGSVRENGLAGFGAPYDDAFYCDDNTSDADSGIFWRFASIDLDGTPTSIDSGTILALDRTNLDGGAGANGVVRFRCEATNTPATGNVGTRPDLRTYNAALNNHTFPTSTADQNVALATAIGGLITAGYSYTGSASHAIMIGAGAQDQWGITVSPVTYRGIGYDVNHPTGLPADLTIVYTPSGGGGSYSIAADRGTFALTGVAANLRANRVLVAQSGSFARLGIAAGLNRGRYIAANVGSFTLVGNAAGLNRGRYVAANVGSFSLVGNASSLERDARLSSETGSFSLVGNAATLIGGRFVTANSGSFSLVGNAATFERDARIATNVGSFSLAGNATALNRGRYVAANVGTFDLTGNDAALERDARIVGDRGTFALAGIATTLTRGRYVAAQTGAFVLAGSAELQADQIFAADRGTFSFVGNAADLSFSAGASLPAQTGSFSLAGNAAALRADRDLLAEVGTFSLDGDAATFGVERALSASTGAFVLSGVAVNLRASRRMVAAPGSFVATGSEANLVRGFSLVASNGNFALVRSDATLRANRVFSAGVFVLSGVAVEFDFGETIQALVTVRVVPLASISVRVVPSTSISVRTFPATIISTRLAMTDTLEVGDVAAIEIKFRNGVTNALGDPSSGWTLTVQRVLDENGNSVDDAAEEYVYGTDNEIERSSIGVYVANIPTTAAGKHVFSVDSSGGAVLPGSKNGLFFVDPRAT